MIYIDIELHRYIEIHRDRDTWILIYIEQEIQRIEIEIHRDM